ncbi:MAG: RnfABCDGE type electron transport complex subunit D [Clostridia bacterium]|nr:RnfABCDGE type electron transport complex subunit D [Clostridia bacterium]
MEKDTLNRAESAHTEAKATATDTTPADEKPAPAKKVIDPFRKLTVSTSPHIKSAVTTRSIMIDVLIALIPSFIWGVYVFGMRAFSIVVISVLASVGFEALYQVLMKKRITVSDCSAAVTGLLLGMNLPATVPLWLPIIGAFFAIVIVKQLYGGIGKNFMNPALAARAFLMLAWPTEMTTTPAPLTSSSAFAVSIDSADIVASATPMQLLKNGTIPDGGMFNFLLGSKAGTIGEVSTLLLIAGGIYLLVRRVISWHTPVAYIGTVALIAYLFPQNAAARTEFVAYELICGGLMLGAIFMATDYATTPITAKGRLIFGVGCGCITMFIRYFGGYPEGITFSILIMNTLVWYIDRLTRPKKFGGVSENGK